MSHQVHTITTRGREIQGIPLRNVPSVREMRILDDFKVAVRPGGLSTTPASTSRAHKQASTAGLASWSSVSRASSAEAPTTKPGRQGEGAATRNIEIAEGAHRGTRAQRRSAPRQTGRPVLDIESKNRFRLSQLQIPRHIRPNSSPREVRLRNPPSTRWNAKQTSRPAPRSAGRFARRATSGWLSLLLAGRASFSRWTAHTETRRCHAHAGWDP
jgi:hypothetical protein